MIALALCALILGLVTGVFAMLYGTERRVRPQPTTLPRPQSGVHDTTAEPSPLLNAASVAAFGVAFGLTGYLVARHTTWSTMLQLVVAGFAGGLALAVQSLLIARWAIPSARADQVDERYLLQGTLATITREVPAGGTGVLHYMLDGQAFTLPARDTDGAAIMEGSDVVIDRIELGIAFVESWSRVESRL